MDKSLSPSVFIAEALGIKNPVAEDSITATEACQCNSCGRNIEAGEPVKKAESNEFFSSTADLANYGGIMCWQCALMRSKKLLNALSYTLTTKEGVFKAAKNEEKAGVFLNPPKEPFVLMNSTATMMHLSWRSKITFDPRRIQYRLGNYMLIVNSERLHQFLAVVKKLKVESSSKTAFPFLFGKLNDPVFGKIHPKMTQYLSKEDLNLLNSMTPGDIAASYALTGNSYEKIAPLENITQQIVEKL